MRLATQCPFCQTAFRVAPEQLSLRGGLVRCGHCKEVFDGNQYLVSPDVLTTAPAAASAAPSIAPSLPQPVTPSNDHSDSQFTPRSSEPPTPTPTITIASATDVATTSTPAASEVPPWMAANLADTFATVAAATSDAPWGAPSETNPAVEVAPALSTPLPQTSATNQAPAIVDTRSDTATDSVSDTEADTDADTEADTEADSATAPASTPSATGTRTATAVAEATKPAESGSERDPIDTARIGDAEDAVMEEAEAAEGALEEVEEVDEVEYAEEIQEVEENGEDEEDDAELPGFVKRAERRARLARVGRACMAVGVVLLVLTLVLQALYLGRNQLLVWLPATRAPLTALCEQLHCRLGLPSNIEQLSLESSELQLVPPNQNIYSLNLLLRNRSATADNWPYLELTINDADDKPLTRRIFMPKEYLPSVQQVSDGFAGESEQPVKLTFELTQPAAAGYRVYLFFP